ncbi:protein of unknown function [Taphrina deformans PYCC 5710]|uniref:RNA-binding protein VTS1 n=1 Tax=Taphrina deformans (strain PYCC 5710 / ATCC 11124 / CBS 356.35 / IMI 108563 / JCM 9778 / NBRC 8474) TaxID=1097556 RepID=R4XK54_TAPDE|nr:protein of unknown function [Taphrina deformans PYCC 5710]|eukprot:CCG83698.1 protein of unknown function [Taphrina deformans PYCC 5710]
MLRQYYTEFEALGYDQWLADISYYEATLGDMATASLDQNFKEELGAIEQWFRVLNDAERTSALYSLLGQATQVQIRFLIMVLQQKANQDPLSDILSPANFNKDVMSQQSMQGIPRAMPSPSFYRPAHSSNIDHAAIQQMFPDAAAALANQRAELNRKKNGQSIVGVPASGTIQTTLSLPPKEDGARTPWTPSFRKNLDSPARPKSAEPQNSNNARVASSGTPLRNSRTDLSATSAPYSPFGETGGGSWASMTNTPATAMFPPITSSMERMSLADDSRNLSANTGFGGNISGPEQDLRNLRKPIRSVSEAGHANALPIAPVMMYDENGQLMSLQAAQHLSSPITSRHMQPLLSTPTQMGAWHLINPTSNGFVFPSSSPAMSMEGYGSDHSNVRRRTPQPKPAENPADLRLLNDIPAWLRQLRLHKYTDELKSTKWQDLVRLDDAGLEAKGISAQGARRKLLKAFEVVNQAMTTGQLQA